MAREKKRSSGPHITVYSFVDLMKSVHAAANSAHSWLFFFRGTKAHTQLGEAITIEKKVIKLDEYIVKLKGPSILNLCVYRR